jgi:hypothetical protein
VWDVRAEYIIVAQGIHTDMDAEMEASLSRNYQEVYVHPRIIVSKAAGCFIQVHDVGPDFLSRLEAAILSEV